MPDLVVSEGTDEAESGPADTASVRFTVGNARAVDSRTIFALVDITMELAGVEFGIFGVQARREAGAQTSIRLPTFKDMNRTGFVGGWFR